MKTIVLTFILLVAKISIASTHVICLGITKNNLPFRLDIDRSDMLDPKTHEADFKAAITMENQVISYAGTAMALYGLGSHHDSVVAYDYDIKEKPALSRNEPINPIHFQTTTRFNTQSYVRNEMQCNGRYIQDECYPGDVNGPPGCGPVYEYEGTITSLSCTMD